MLKLNNKKSNRRLDFRIYEQVNLFYHKIDPLRLNAAKPAFDTFLSDYVRNQPSELFSSAVENPAVDSSLPGSQSRENDTLNVNLSRSGIAFTCKEQLKTGDYLMVRLFFLSGMAVVMTCCKVVYCKPSNPYETDQYPYLVGAQFINLTAEDSALLNSIVSKRKKYQIVGYGVLFSFLTALLLMPEDIFGLIVELTDHLTDAILDLWFLASDYLGLGLKRSIPYLFHTTPRVTDIAGFYIQQGIEFVVMLFIVRFGWLAIKRVSQKSAAFLARKKASALYYWGEKSWLDKLKVISLGVAVVSGYVMFGL
ncbi:PilZ domain-containing protein [Methylomonas methanica]|uniref:Type IV pilus assembly PilZ n=1 Tax=Methylomonas methanica (strain DSM 25384 / MC09) TaxID=857087 RepID=G0A2V3_METMM|nr:PilZ domain-containing protein [Methylomonas methanica]AEG01456.1 type IV pilus assembly PilZ [Methylomonas methanica MC09]